MNMSSYHAAGMPSPDADRTHFQPALDPTEAEGGNASFSEDASAARADAVRRERDAIASALGRSERPQGAGAARTAAEPARQDPAPQASPAGARIGAVADTDRVVGVDHARTAPPPPAATHTKDPHDIADGSSGAAEPDATSEARRTFRANHAAAAVSGQAHAVAQVVDRVNRVVMAADGTPGHDFPLAEFDRDQWAALSKAHQDVIKDAARAGERFLEKDTNRLADTMTGAALATEIYHASLDQSQAQVHVGVGGMAQAELADRFRATFAAQARSRLVLEADGEGGGRVTTFAQLVQEQGSEENAAAYLATWMGERGHAITLQTSRRDAALTGGAWGQQGASVALPASGIADDAQRRTFDGEETRAAVAEGLAAWGTTALQSWTPEGLDTRAAEWPPEAAIVERTRAFMGEQARRPAAALVGGRAATAWADRVDAMGGGVDYGATYDRFYALVALSPAMRAIVDQDHSLRSEAPTLLANAPSDVRFTSEVPAAEAAPPDASGSDTPASAAGAEPSATVTIGPAPADRPADRAAVEEEVESSLPDALPEDPAAPMPDPVVAPVAAAPAAEVPPSDASTPSAAPAGGTGALEAIGPDAVAHEVVHEPERMDPERMTAAVQVTVTLSPAAADRMAETVEAAVTRAGGHADRHQALEALGYDAESELIVLSEDAVPADRDRIRARGRLALLDAADSQGWARYAAGVDREASWTHGLIQQIEAHRTEAVMKLLEADGHGPADVLPALDAKIAERAASGAPEAAELPKAAAMVDAMVGVVSDAYLLPMDEIVDDRTLSPPSYWQPSPEPALPIEAAVPYPHLEETPPPIIDLEVASDPTVPYPHVEPTPPPLVVIDPWRRSS